MLVRDFGKHWKRLSLKSFKIAEKSGLSILQQQELLTIASENKRLSYLLEHFDKLEEKLEENRYDEEYYSWGWVSELTLRF